MFLVFLQAAAGNYPLWIR